MSMFSDVEVTHKSGSGSGLKKAIIQMIVQMTETSKKTITPHEIAVLLNKTGSWNVNKEKVRVALQKIRNTANATAEKDGRFTEEIPKYGVYLNYNEGQGVSYAAKPIPKGKK